MRPAAREGSRAPLLSYFKTQDQAYSVENTVPGNFRMGFQIFFDFFLFFLLSHVSRSRESTPKGPMLPMPFCRDPARHFRPRSKIASPAIMLLRPFTLAFEVLTRAGA